MSRLNCLSLFQILKNPKKYVIMHRRQKQYEAAYGENTFFSLPSKPSASGGNLKRADANVRELTRSDANVKDTSFTLTKLRMALNERSTAIYTKLISGDKGFLMDSLKTTVSIIQNIAKPIGENE